MRCLRVSCCSSTYTIVSGVKVRVKRGDSTTSIAFAHGLFPETVWNHPQNAELRALRKYPNVLLEGDELFVPAKFQRFESCATDRTHKFVRRGIPEYARIQILDVRGDPWADAPYTWKSESGSGRGRTTADGFVVQRILPSDRQGRIEVGEPPDQMVFEVLLGHLDPVSTLAGVRQRLANLGYAVGPESEQETAALRAAVHQYRLDRGLEPGDAIDDALRADLEQGHRV